MVDGRARAKQTQRRGREAHHDPTAALPVVIHGDAAFAGQGVVAETLNLGALAGYRTGGTLHIITNNQVGFTTDMEDARSTRYASDLAKGFDIPIIHVNADDAEACLAAVRLAMAYREQFHQDVADRSGRLPAARPQRGRRAGLHPAADVRADQEPADGAGAATREQLVAAGVLTQEEADRAGEASLPAPGGHPAGLQGEHGHGAIAAEPRPARAAPGQEVETAVLGGVPDRAQRAAAHAGPRASPSIPSSSKQLERRRTALGPEGGIDWAHAEALALASLLTEGVPIRLTGQDTERGTFSQRHLVLHDAKTGQRWTPIQRLPGALAPMELHNSPLSELATLGLRIRLQRGGTRGAGALGGAVRRLHQRRPGHRGPVPRRPGSRSGGSPPG